MNKIELEDKINQRVERLEKKVKDKEGPKKLIEILSRSGPKAFTRSKAGSRDNLAAKYPKWEEELFSMYNDIDSYVEEYELAKMEDEF